MCFYLTTSPTSGLELDEKEKELMAAMGTDTDEYRAFLAAGSTNVALDGNFSVQVIAKALENMNVFMTDMQSEDAKHVREDPLQASAFICNYDSHWIAIRRLNGHYFNLNSLEPLGPKRIGDFYLSAYLEQLQRERYSIFVVSGQLPRPNRELGTDGVWCSIDEMLAGRSGRPDRDAVMAKLLAENKSSGNGNSGNRARPPPPAGAPPQQLTEQQMIERAINASLADTSTTSGHAPSASSDDLLQAALQASLQDYSAANMPSAPPASNNDSGAMDLTGDNDNENDNDNDNAEVEEDADLAAAIRMSLGQS
jgi:Josephin/Ubiquitin interaction motif